MTIRLAERKLRTKFGDYTEVLYYDGRRESIALVMGEVRGGAEVLCRVHSACVGGHVFSSIECECAGEMAAAQQAIRRAGRGVIIYLDQEGKGNGHLALIKSSPFKEAGFTQGEAYEKAGYSPDARSYLLAAQMLGDLRVVSIDLLTENPRRAEELQSLGIEVARTTSLR